MSNQTAFAHPPKTKELIKDCLKNKQQQQNKKAAKKKKALQCGRTGHLFLLSLAACDNYNTPKTEPP